MEVYVTPETEAQLAALAKTTGRDAGLLLEDALAGYFGELQTVRETLDRRYDEIATGAVTTVSGESVQAHFLEKSRDRRERS